MPIATPEIYAQMLDRAKQQGFAYPAINVTSTQTLNAALSGFAGADSDGIVQISTGGAEYLSGSGQGHGDGRERAGRVRPRRRGQVSRSTSRCTPTTAPRTSWTATCARWCDSPRSGSPAARSRCSSRTCGTARPYRWTRTWRSPPNCSTSARPPASSWRWRSASSAARKTAWSARSTRSCTPRRRTRSRWPRRSGSASAAGTYWPPRSATCTASTSPATSSCGRRC